MFEKKTLSQAIRPALLLSVLAGIRPAGRSVACTLALAGYVALVFCLLCYGTLGSFLWLQTVDYLLYDSFMHLALEKSQKAFLFFSYAVVIVYAVYYQGPFNRILDVLRSVDRSLSDLQIKVTYDLKYVASTAVVKFTFLLILCVLDYFLSTDVKFWLYTFTDLISTHGPLIPIFAYELQMYALLMFIADHFRFISEGLSTIIDQMSVPDALPRVYKLLRVYSNLRDMSMELNRLSAIPILITVASIFFLGIVNFHLVGIAGPYRKTVLFAFLIGSVVLRLYELWNIVQPFVRITVEVEAFNNVLFKWLLYDQTEILRKQVLAAATTLLVILVQYSLSKTQLWCD